ncbi:hypothetical protein WL88_01400 [Burkholderia diffusa]|uniref:Uncharacterized protein n=1 Tax=Burkholderia diffusa TaxID=488732 RepID=A0AAW3PIE2_9BURK|nr:hypothetical protein WL85_14005 [Burkholderia diffusa]KWF48363.1 hypothetical protein WL87_19565 [Burkholderia diffusa]KWF55644.1 hypothetical protein WL88_01400 [Burkholderia diffusa]
MDIPSRVDRMFACVPMWRECPSAARESARGRRQSRSGELYRAVVITVVAMRVMKAAVDQIIDVIAVRYSLVPATRAVHMTRLMVTAVRRTFVRIFRADLDLMFVDMIAVRMVQVAIMEIVYVVAMLDCGVTAVRAMLMVMVSMMGFVAGAHAYLLCSRDRAKASNGRLFTIHRRGSRKDEPAGSRLFREKTELANRPVPPV